jgi:hypothetical protein
MQTPGARCFHGRNDGAEQKGQRHDVLEKQCQRPPQFPPGESPHALEFGRRSIRLHGKVMQDPVGNHRQQDATPPWQQRSNFHQIFKSRCLFSRHGNAFSDFSQGGIMPKKLLPARAPWTGRQPD